MITVTVCYPAAEGSAFDFDYYRDVHMPLVADRWSGTAFAGGEAIRGLPGADGRPAPFHAIAILRFDSLDGFRQAIGSPAATEILGDIPNFTDVQPVVQVSETLWESESG